MKIPAFLSMPWDMVVFLTITTVGFGFAMQKFRNPTSLRESFGISTSVNTAAAGNEVIAESIHEVLDLGCVESRGSRRLVVNDLSTVRIRGKFCEMSRRQMRNFQGVQVKNVTNGLSGTVFMQGFDRSFVTDLVKLDSGRNVIEVSWQDPLKSSRRVVRTEVFEH